MTDTEQLIERLLAHTAGRTIHNGCLLCEAALQLTWLELSRTHLTDQLRWHEQQGHL